MAFQYITFTTAAQQLAGRLQDPNLVYWNQPNELLECLYEAVRFNQALTGSYKQKLNFNTAARKNYYSLSDPSVVPNTPLQNFVTDVEVANNILAALLEPPLTTGWTGTGQFTFAQLQAAMQARLNRFIGDTGRQVTQQNIGGPSPPIDLVSLPDGVLDVRRAAWMPLPGVQIYPLGRMDEWAEQTYIPAATQQPTQPIAYSVYGVPPQTLRCIPPPLSNGEIDLLIVQSGVTLNLNPASPVVIGISDDLTPAVKWGALADLLGSDGPSRDYARAAYCEQRYREFVEVARIYASVLTGSINNVTCGIGSVFDLDFYQPDWQQTSGPPTFVGIAGRHLACVGQTPDGVYGISLWTCANAPVSGYMQIGRDQIDPVLDYAQHIASFKMGGAEFDGTDRLYQNLITSAKAQNGRLEAIAFYKCQAELPATKGDMEMARMIA